MKFLEYLQGLGISDWVAASDFGYPIMLAIHSIGLAMVVGITVMMDLRILGFASHFPLSGFSRLTTYVKAGFLINAVSGALLFMSNATQFVYNWPFLLKMTSVVVGMAAFLALSHELRLDEYAANNGEATRVEPDVTVRVRAIAMISVGAWVIGIVAGRLIAYVLDAQNGL